MLKKFFLYNIRTGQKNFGRGFFQKKMVFCFLDLKFLNFVNFFYFFYQKILLSSRAFQISGFRQERVNRSGDMSTGGRGRVDPALPPLVRMKE